MNDAKHIGRDGSGRMDQSCEPLPPTADPCYLSAIPKRSSPSPSPLSAFRAFGLLLCLTLSALLPLDASARPRPPIPPYPEAKLSAFSFDQAYFQFGATSAPETVDGTDLVESFSGYALRREGSTVTPFLMPVLRQDGKPNFNLDRGTIRFWYRPNFTTSQGQQGPLQSHPRLLELASSSGSQAEVWWALYLDTAGSTVYLSGLGQQGATDLLQATVQWAAGDWHMLALSYTPTNTSLVIDGVTAATGLPFLSMPAQTRITAAIALGSTVTGDAPGQGQFDEVSGLGPAWQSTDFAFYYAAVGPVALQGAITEQEVQSRNQIRQTRTLNSTAIRSDNIFLSLEESGPYLPLYSGTNANTPTTSWAWAQGLDHTTNLSFSAIGYTVTNQTTNLYLTLANTDSTNSYDIYVSTNLNPVYFQSNAIGGVAWSFLTNLAPGSTNLTLSNPTASGSFFAMAPHIDTDGDGLFDGDELFLYRTDPNSADTGNTGTPDAYKDPDGDGWTNLQEARQGTNPNVWDTPPPPTGFAIRLTQTQNGADLNWQPTEGTNVIGYQLTRFDSNSTSVFEFAASVTNYTDTVAAGLPADTVYQRRYSLVAQYTPGLSQSTPQIALASDGEEFVVTRGPGGVLFLACRQIATNDTVTLTYTTNATDVSVTVEGTRFVNGVASVPEVPASLALVSARARVLHSDGRLLRPKVILAPSAGASFPGYESGWVNGAACLAENLRFRLRAATALNLFATEVYTGANFVDSLSQPPGSTNCAHASFWKLRCPSTQISPGSQTNLTAEVEWPLVENRLLINCLWDANYFAPISGYAAYGFTTGVTRFGWDTYFRWQFFDAVAFSTDLETYLAGITPSLATHPDSDWIYAGGNTTKLSGTDVYLLVTEMGLYYTPFIDIQGQDRKEHHVGLSSYARNR